MSNVNASIYAVDTAMDIMSGFINEVHDLCARISFELKSTVDLLDRCGADEYSKDRIFAMKCTAQDFEAEWKAMCEELCHQGEDAKKIMADYVRKLDKIAGTVPYYVAIVDSERYPQTAEHILRAQKMGFPEFVTLDRDNAAQRRILSLAGVEVRDIYDRDEWPMAVFREGGSNANVVYIEGSDNRGAGSSVGRQLRGIPDGSIVRVRVV